MNILKAILMSMCLFACQPLSQVNWPDKVECLSPVGDLLGAVTRILFESAKVDAELKALGEEHGFDSVVCAVESLRRDWTSPGAAMSDQRLDALRKANAFLVETGTEVTFK